MVGSQQYRKLRAALWSVKQDSSAVISILSSHSDGGKAWIEQAYSELRYKLAHGRLADGEEIGRLLLAVLEAKETLQKKATTGWNFGPELDQLVGGIGTILAQDNMGGVRQLEAVSDRVTSQPTLVWIACLWTCRAHMDAGDLEKAAKAGQDLVEVSANLGQHAIGTALCTIGEVDFRRGNFGQALENLAEAAKTFEKEGDKRGVATALVAKAKAYLAANDGKNAETAALQAMLEDPKWSAPAIFLSRLNLRNGHVDTAEGYLRRLSAQQAVGIDREEGLIRALKSGEISQEGLSEYLELQDEIPSKALLKRLEKVVALNESFLPLQELLAWTLLRLGSDARAAAVFESLASLDLDPDLQASVLLGLGSLANRKARQRPVAARVSAAAAVGSRARKTVRFSLDDDLLPSLTEAAKRTRTVAPGGSSNKPAALTGSLRLFSVPDLLEFLHNSRRTGTLIVTSDLGVGAVHLRGGRLAGAAIPNELPLGQALVASGAISADTLNQALKLAAAEEAGKLLGTVLVERGWVERASLTKVLEGKVHDAIRCLLGWTEGQFRFDPDRRAQAELAEVELEMDTQAVLLEVYRQLDEDARDL